MPRSFAIAAWLLAACGAPPGSSYLIYVRDRQGSVVAAVDDRGKKVWETHDDAYGLRLSSSGAEVPREFLDQPFDEETGFYQFQYRTYDPATAQWLSPDPMLISDPEYCTKNPELCNPYAYGGDRPGEWTDPDGRAVSVELMESSVVVHGSVAVFGSHAAEVVTALQNIQAKVLQGTDNRLDLTIHVYERREQIPANESQIDANVGECSRDESDALHQTSSITVGKDLNDASRAPTVLWHELLHLAGADDAYRNIMSADGRLHSVSFPGEESSYMGAFEAKLLRMTPLLRGQLEHPSPGDEPNQELNQTPSCDGTPTLDGPISRSSSQAYSY